LTQRPEPSHDGDAEQVAFSPGFVTNLDLSNLSEITPEEERALIDWYETAHGDGAGDLTPFVPFLIQNGPAHLKLYRAYAQSLHELGALPQVIVPLLFLHYYMSIGSERGVLYEVVASRQWGANKREVLETIGLTFVESGPFGANAASASSEYLASWQGDEPRRVECEWPAHWHTESLTQSEISDDSPTGRLLAQRAPGVLSALRARVRKARANTQLNPVVFVLYDLHGAVARGRANDAARATRAALEAGVRTNEILEVVGFGALYATSNQLDEIAEALEPILNSAD
jgi:alkylhydroperoxidase/carboxymuconolactone decarboxylase family protein YurZ